MCKKIAVILLPGILGSPLEISTSGAKLQHYPYDAWPVDQLGASSPLLSKTFCNMPLREKLSRFVSLDSPDLASRVRVKEATVNDKDGTTANVATFYRAFIKEAVTGGHLNFGGRPYSVHVLNYDWTLPIQKICPIVHAGTTKIMLEAKADCYMYVTHSMGGLVAMDVIRKYELWNHEPFIGAVRVACPVMGAPETLARMLTGITTDFNIDPRTWGEVFSTVAAKMLGNEGWRFSLLMACVPGISSLLPPEAVYLFEKILNLHKQTPVVKDTRQHEAWFLLQVLDDKLTKKMRESVNLACKFHQSVIEHAEQIERCITAVALTGKKTLQSFNPANINNQGLSEPEYTDKGDGTVPDWIQASVCYKVFPVHGGVDHSDAFENKSVGGISDNLKTIFEAINDRFEHWVDSKK